MRVKSRWSLKDKARTLEEVAGALGTAIWQMAANGLLHLENEGFQIDTQSQRLDVIQEFTAFLIHVADRMTCERLEPDARTRFITSLAMHVARVFEDNALDVRGPGAHQRVYVERLNERLSDYADFSYDGEPSFGMRRFFGDRVTDVVGPKDRKWVTDQVMDIEAPEAVKTLARAVRSLMGE